jgi:hypothetical protein
MAVTPEGKVKAGVKKYLASVGAWYAMPMGTGFGSSGVPDFLVCWQGKFFGIETKAPGKLKGTTTLQKLQLAAIQAAGGQSIVIDDWAQLKPLFEST